ncbi:serine protease, partial [Streptomyces sp. NPDC059994]
MTDQVFPGQGPGTAGPGPDGAGFTYQGAEPELIVVARPDSGADTTALTMFLGDQQLALEPLFGRGAPPGLSLFHRVRGGADRAEEIAARLAALPGVETAYVKPGAVPADYAGPDEEAVRRLREGAPVTPDFTGRQGYLRAAPEGVDAYWAWQRGGGMHQGRQPLVLPSAVEAASVTSGIATRFRDVVAPLPGRTPGRARSRP